MPGPRNAITQGAISMRWTCSCPTRTIC